MILLISLFFSWQAYAVIRPGLHSDKVNDLYFKYQWSLENSGQVVVGDIDDITPVETKGVSWAHIDWDSEIDSLIKKETVVAVIDSGVDLEHEDLKGRILLNDKECRDGRIPLGQTGDPDKNGFEGDCAGWNFATRDVRRQRLVDDDVGHGTHVAGIIAANINNGIGLAGLSNRIKILPLKVYDSHEGKLPPGTQDIISLRVARAINYAVSRNVDVINLSLGWPIVANIPEVKEAIMNAEKSGVMVVAAAGNDRHEAQIYPCAFSSVFCVGSINVDGEVSRFSNFGGHVDILAPGGQILGLIPMTLSSEYFGMKGYDIKFGTSQAAPYVSGAVAILKGIFPDASNEDIRSALIATARKVPSVASGLEVFSTSGLIQIKKAIEFIQNKERPVARPVLKEWDRLVLDEKTLSADYEVPFINPQLVKAEVISVNSLNSDVQIDSQWTGEKLRLSFSVYQEWASANLKFEIKVEDQVYTHQILLVKSIKTNKRVFKASSGLLSNLQTVPAPSQIETEPRFFHFNKEEKKLSIYALENGEVILKIEKKLSEIDSLLDGIGIQRFDLNLDGKLDYWISGLVLDENGQAQDLRYVFFDDEGNLINQNLHESGNKTLRVELTYVLPVPAQSRLLKINHPQWGEIFIPAFLNYGPLEPQDQTSDVFDTNPSLVGTHLYFLMPELQGSEVIWKVRSFTKSGVQKKLRSILNLPSWAKFEFLNLRLLEESSSGEIQLLFRTGSGVVQDYYHLHLTGKELLESAFGKPEEFLSQLKITPFTTKFDFSNQSFDAAFVLNDEGEISRKTVLRGQYSRDRVRSLLLGTHQVEDQYSYRTNDPREFVASLIKEYHYPDKSVRFFELDTVLDVVVNTEMGEKRFSAPLYRTSFIQGSMFSLRFNPMFSFDEEGRPAPSLYVDNSTLFSSTFYMWVATADKVYVPVKHSFEIPQGCQAMNPMFHQKQPYAVLFCKGQNGPETIELVAF